MAITRDEAIIKLAKEIAQGGWSSIYSFVESHAEDWELDLEDEEDNETTEEK